MNLIFNLKKSDNKFTNRVGICGRENKISNDQLTFDQISKPTATTTRTFMLGLPFGQTYIQIALTISQLLTSFVFSKLMALAGRVEAPGWKHPRFPIVTGVF